MLTGLLSLGVGLRRGTVLLSVVVVANLFADFKRQAGSHLLLGKKLDLH